MKFVSLRIKRGIFEDSFTFPSNINIIYSIKNSVGKTTLVRFLIYALGYPIPSTKGINFNKFELFLSILDKDYIQCELYRNQDYITFERNGIEKSYSLPNDINELHKQIFGINNYNLLENLLGAYYVDQEKGWTLLNRGKVIGNIHFSIEEFILGLSDRSCDDLNNQLNIVKHELKKYRHMFDTAQYQKEINELSENIAYDNEEEETQKLLDILNFERKPIINELKRVEDVIKKNISFKKYINSMKLFVKAEDGSEIPVNENTIVGYQDTFNYVITKRQLISNQLAKINNKIQVLENRQKKETTLFKVQTMIQAFDSNISKIHIDLRATENVIKRLDKERKILEEQISQSIKANNPVISELYQTISKYALELGINENFITSHNDYIFTSDLKSLSGAIFHKIVFIFKLAYIKTVYNHTDVILPIILDSPSGREVEKINIDDMMEILKRDFKNHQIIIASIYQYDFSNKNIIEIKDKLLSF